MNHQSQFVLISETFLKMYNTIFRRLHSFILSNENTEWTKRTHHQVPFVDEELTDFQVRTLISLINVEVGINEFEWKKTKKFQKPESCR